MRFMIRDHASIGEAHYANDTTAPAFAIPAFAGSWRDLRGSTSDPPGYPRYGLSDEPDVYVNPLNYAHGPAYRERNGEDDHCRRDRSDPDRMICDRE